MGVVASFKGAASRVACCGRWLKAVLKPALLLWPWLLSTAAFFVFLQSSQGRAVTWEMSASAWYDWSSVLALAASFAATLLACLLTSLVVLSWHRRNSLPAGGTDEADIAATRQDRRRLGVLHIVWAFALSSAPMLLLAWATRSLVALAITLSLGALAFVALHVGLLRGAWADGAAWSSRLAQLHRRRFWLAFGAVAVASAPLVVAAMRLVDAPDTAADLGPAFVAILGLCALSSLFAALFIALPHCTSHPRLAGLLPALLVACNVLFQPLADADNPLLREESNRARALYDLGSTQSAGCSRTTRNLETALQNQAMRVVDETASAGTVPSLYFISAEGGGIRAAYWTAMGLVHLEESIPDFRDRIATMTGVSGGSLGIATWLAAVEATDSVEARRDLIHKFLGSDLLSPAIAGLMFLDSPRLIFGPLWFTPRRDDIFEAVVAKRWQRLAGKDADFFVRPLVALCFLKLKQPPTLYFGATEVLQGAFAPMGNTNFALPAGSRTFINRLLRASDLMTANVVHSVVMSARFPLLAPTADVGVSLEDVHDYLATEQAPLPRAIRVKMNGGKTPDGFPTIPGSARLGVLVDGGYFDNSGLSMTRYALDTLATRLAPPKVAFPERGIIPQRELDRSAQASESARGVVATHVIHFSNDPSSVCVEPQGWKAASSRAVVEAIERARFKPICSFQLNELESLFRPRWFGWLSSPAETILAVRQGHATHELNAMARQLKTRPNPSALFHYSLAGELTQQLCEARAEEDRDACLGHGGRAGAPDWRIGTAEEGRPAIQQRAVSCHGLEQLTPLPLGWTLHPRDTMLMQCLAANAALNARVRLADSDDDFRRVALPKAAGPASGAATSQRDRGLPGTSSR